MMPTFSRPNVSAAKRAVGGTDDVQHTDGGKQARCHDLWDAVLHRGGDQVRADEAVGAETTDEETPGQQPKVARAEPEREADQGSGDRGARRPRRDRRVGLAEGAKADVTRVVTH